MISGGRTVFVTTVLRAATTVDALGRRTQTYTNVGTIRCAGLESAPGEQLYAEGANVIGTFELRTRWPNIARLSVTNVDRLTFRGRTLRINGIRNLDQRNRLAIIDCTEVA